MKSREFISYPFYWDKVPIDLSFIYEAEKPAGKHGFLKIQQERFVFEDGTPGLFWGTNFNSGACFPAADFSEKVAKRLARIGVNLVRFHQMDAEWSVPNIFQFSKGKRIGNTQKFDSESMKRLDYLIYCLRQEGIYIYLDMLTYRKFKSGDGVESADLLSDAAKPYNNFSRKLIELQKKFNADLWTHMNPYTGLAYKDDPAIVLTEVVNESDLANKECLKLIEPYKTELDGMFHSWLSKNSMVYKSEVIDFTSEDRVIEEFLIYTQQEYYKEIIEHLRSIGVKIPAAGTNWPINAANQRAQTVTDFADGHAYWYSWEWTVEQRKFMNQSMVKEQGTTLPELFFSRHKDKPYFVSEWDNPWPNEWRAESSVYLASISAFQGWAGMAIHTYAYTDSTRNDITGKEISSETMGGVPYREGVFCTWNDPAKFGLFYHAALLFRRGDVQAAKQRIILRPEGNAIGYWGIPELHSLPERHMLLLDFDENSVKTENNDYLDNYYSSATPGEFLSDTGEIYRNPEKGIGWIDTERTKVVYGFCGEAGKIMLKDISVLCETDFATIAVSSLTDDGISISDNMLLTTVGRSENTGMKFNEDHTELLCVGSAPILVEVIKAEIVICSSVPGMKVLSMNAEGFIIGTLPSEYKDGVFRFKVGEKYPSMYYLIQAE